MLTKQAHQQEGVLVEFPSSHKDANGHLIWLNENLNVLMQNPVRYKTAIANCKRRIEKVKRLIALDSNR